jgi:hypothetical protein|tara:strand:- start:215 stop:541 length:327 start_codon:yes stop_codon:yes gene_type:complete
MGQMKKTPEGFDEHILPYLKGDVPLIISFWGIYVFSWNIVFFNILYLILARMGFELKIIQLIAAPIFFILAIGVWNSARKYKGKKIWSVLARVGVVLQCIAAVTIHLH